MTVVTSPKKRGRLPKSRTTISSASMLRSEADFLLGLGVFALLFGWVLYWTYAEQARDAVAAHGWPTAPGVITESRTVQGRTADPPGPLVRYDYTVGGKQLSGSGVDLSIASWDTEPARDVVARYPVGKKVQVYYDPADPEACTLEQTVLDIWDDLLLWTGSVLRWGGAVCVVLAFVLEWMSKRARR